MRGLLDGGLRVQGLGLGFRKTFRGCWTAAAMDPMVMCVYDRITHVTSGLHNAHMGTELWRSHG